MAEYSFADEDSDIENELEDNKQFISNINGTIFVIDCSDDMIVKDESIGASQLTLTTEAVKNIYCNKLISGSADFLGVVLCGTNTETSGYNGVHTLIPLDQTDKKDVLKLDGFMESCRNREPLHGHGIEYKPHELLWICSSMFTSCPKKIRNRQVMILTNVPEPYGVDKQENKLAVTKARDMSELGITIDLLPLKPTNGEDFDLKRFYSSLVPDEEFVKPATDLETLSERVHRRETKLRRLANLPLVVGGEFTIGIECYSMFGSSKIPYQNLCSKTSRPVTCQTNLVTEDTRKVLLHHEQYQAAQFGSEKITFSHTEAEAMKLQTDKGVYLIGFKPANDAFKLHHVSGKSTFVRPSESLYKGSSNFFVALLERCLARDVVPLVHCVPRAGTIGYIAILLPQQELRGENNEQIKAAGFHMVRLPFADDIRPLEYDAVIKPEPNEIEIARKLVKKLKAHFDPSLIDNPNEQQFQKTLEAIALEKDSIEEVQDLTKPDTEAIDKRASNIAAEFKEKFIGMDYVIPKDCQKPDYKKVIAKIQDMQLQGILDKATVADLRLFAKGARLKVPSTANRSHLLQAIKSFLG